MTASIKEQVLAAEDAYVAAEVARDEETLRRLVDDRFVFNQSNGTTLGKEDLIDAILRMSMTGQTLRARTVLIEGDCVLIFGTAELRFANPDGEDKIVTYRYSSTYTNSHDQWRMIALQMQEYTGGPPSEKSD